MLVNAHTEYSSLWQSQTLINSSTKLDFLVTHPPHADQLQSDAKPWSCLMNFTLMTKRMFYTLVLGLHARSTKQIQCTDVAFQNAQKSIVLNWHFPNYHRELPFSEAVFLSAKKYLLMFQFCGKGKLQQSAVMNTAITSAKTNSTNTENKYKLHCGDCVY